MYIKKKVWKFRADTYEPSPGPFLFTRCAWLTAAAERDRRPLIWYGRENVATCASWVTLQFFVFPKHHAWCCSTSTHESEAPSNGLRWHEQHCSNKNFGRVGVWQSTVLERKKKKTCMRHPCLFHVSWDAFWVSLGCTSNMMFFFLGDVWGTIAASHKGKYVRDCSVRGVIRFKS